MHPGLADHYKHSEVVLSMIQSSSYTLQIKNESLRMGQRSLSADLYSFKARTARNEEPDKQAIQDRILPAGLTHQAKP